MKSNMIKMITICMCMVVVGFAAQKGQEPVKVEQNTVIVKDNSYYDNLRNQLTNPNADEPKVVAEKPNSDQAEIDWNANNPVLEEKSTDELIYEGEKPITDEDGGAYEYDRYCEDTDAGATDPYGDGCAAYANYPSWCGNYNDDDFDSGAMCCACGGGSCTDQDNGATDPYGDGCAAYANYPSWCGNYDDDDFDSNAMCCACGGGGPAASCDSGVYDCAGTCDGTATEDCNGTCGGNGFLDCNGNCTTYDYWIGDGWCDSILACDEFGCDGGDCATDCAGTCGGDAVADCAGTCGGSAVVDECGECGGDGSSCSCDGEYLTVNMVDSWGDGWDGASFCINDECTTVASGSSASYTFCVDLSLANDVTCGGGNYAGEHSWELVDEAGNVILSGGDPYAGCLGDCGVGGCTDANSDNYNADATYDDGSCSAYIGQDCAYYGYPDQSLDCDLYYCVPNSWLGDGGCDSYFACAEFGCDGGDCEDCAGDCLGSAADDACGTCNGDCTESGGSCVNDDSTGDSYGDTCTSWYDAYPNTCGGYDTDDFNAAAQCCACGGGDATAGEISCGDGSCDCDGNVADCNGDCGGSAANDECGVCGGDSSSCADCCGVPNGAGDSCDGDCGACGASIPDGDCDCDGNVTDCAGTCGGDAAADNCGTCDSDSSNDCPQDCAGVFGGDSITDCSGNCVAGWLMGYLGDGWCDGSDAAWGIDLSCYDCDNGDCSEACGCEDTSSCNDDCGVPNGDGSSCADCAGTPNGDAELDYCGICEGDNVANDCGDPCDDGTCDCAGVPGGDSFIDCVGNCVAGWLMGYLGDGYCDDGTWGVDFVACGDFNCDDGDCGTELVDGECVEAAGNCPDGTVDTPGSCSCHADCAEDQYCYGVPGSYGYCWATAECCAYDDAIDGECPGGCDGRTADGDPMTKRAILIAGAEEKVIFEPDIRDDHDCGGTGPDVGCDGVCFSGLVDDECGDCDGGGLNDDGCCYDIAADCAGTCDGSAIADCSDDDCGSVGGWIGDGLCDGASQSWGYDLSCYDCDGGDCIDECGECDGDNSSCADCCGVANGDNSSCGSSGDVNGGGVDVTDIIAMVSDILETEALDECAANEADITGDGNVNVLDVIAAVEIILSGIVSGCTDANAPEYNADATADDGSCWASCTGNLSYLADGWCDGSNNNAECAFDMGDCCPDECAESVADGCPDNPDGCYGSTPGSNCGDCYSCTDPSNPNSNGQGDCDVPPVDCAETFTVSGSDGVNDCYDDGSGYFVFDWDGGCLATYIVYDDGSGDPAEMDLSGYGFTGGFMFYGFAPGTCFDATITFDDGSEVSGSACVDCNEAQSCADTTCGYYLNYGYTCEDLAFYSIDCSACDAEGACGGGASSCADTSCGYYLNYGYTCYDLIGYGYDCSACEAEGVDCSAPPAGCSDSQFDCNGDGSECIPGGYYCDGSYDNGNAGWGPDCTNGADEVIEDCCAAEDATYTGAGLCGGAACEDTDNGATDSYGDGCAGYTTYPSWCGNYDDDDFASMSMCCACGGGSTGGRDADVSNNLKLITLELQNQNSDPQIEGSPDHIKKIAKKSKGNHSLGRATKAIQFESKLQRAESVKLIQTAEGLRHEADGYVGYEITLEHGADFEINVTESAFIADYATTGNTTKVIVVGPETENLFSSTGDYTIIDVIAGTAGGAALNADIVSIPTVFGLNDAYPNPFNPTTSVELAMPQDGFVSVKIYNLMGQVVATLHEGNLTANSYSFTWDAANVASGMYFLKAETAGNMDIQKIMLMK